MMQEYKPSNPNPSPSETILQSIIRGTEDELSFYLTNMTADHLEIIRNAKPHELQYYLDVRKDIEQPILEPQPLDAIPLDQVEDQQELSDIDEDDTITKDEEGNANYNVEIGRELIKETDEGQVFRVTYHNGDIYEGEMEGDMKEGNGQYIYMSGERFDGQFQDDLLHGYGRYTFKGGHEYEGDWYEGEKSGYGILKFSSGDQYKGEFLHDTFEGEGTYISKNGDKFVGVYKNGKKDGFGKFYGSDGRRIIGEWVKDKLQHF